jgi:hypothetical protein
MGDSFKKKLLEVFEDLNKQWDEINYEYRIVGSAIAMMIAILFFSKIILFALAIGLSAQRYVYYTEFVKQDEETETPTE